MNENIFKCQIENACARDIGFHSSGKEVRGQEGHRLVFTNGSSCSPSSTFSPSFRSLDVLRALKGLNTRIVLLLSLCLNPQVAVRCLWLSLSALLTGTLEPAEWRACVDEGEGSAGYHHLSPSMDCPGLRSL